MGDSRAPDGLTRVSSETTPPIFVNGSKHIPIGGPPTYRYRDPMHVLSKFLRKLDCNNQTVNLVKSKKKKHHSSRNSGSFPSNNNALI